MWCFATKGGLVKRYTIILLTTLLGVGAVVAVAAAASTFASQGANVPPERVAQRVRPAATLNPTRAASMIGAQFISQCLFSHRNTDDPIIYPRKPGRSHDHSFVGNDTTNASSTLSSLLKGDTTCDRTDDTAAYWTPTLIDPKGQPITPRIVPVYYRRKTVEDVKAFPPGLKIVAGNSKATTAQDVRNISWDCGPNGGVSRQTTIPKCPDAEQRGVALHVRFPACWDGLNLDSPDHQSHMAYPVSKRCPSDHPVALPEIEINVRYPTKGGSGFALASGGQFSGHADFFNAWTQKTLEQLVNTCLDGAGACQKRV
jgi:hypothetical protein